MPVYTKIAGGEREFLKHRLLWNFFEWGTNKLKWLRRQKICVRHGSKEATSWGWCVPARGKKKITETGIKIVWAALCTKPILTKKSQLLEGECVTSWCLEQLHCGWVRKSKSWQEQGREKNISQRFFVPKSGNWISWEEACAQGLVYISQKIIWGWFWSVPMEWVWGFIHRNYSAAWSQTLQTTSGASEIVVLN